MRHLVVVAVLLAVAGATAGPAGAITEGTADGQQHPNAGGRDYRLDTASARTFLGGYVRLP